MKLKLIKTLAAAVFLVFLVLCFLAGNTLWASIAESPWISDEFERFLRVAFYLVGAIIGVHWVESWLKSEEAKQQ